MPRPHLVASLVLVCISGQTQASDIKCNTCHENLRPEELALERPTGAPRLSTDETAVMSYLRHHSAMARNQRGRTPPSKNDPTAARATKVSTPPSADR
jgi:hypothetical protein